MADSLTRFGSESSKNLVFIDSDNINSNCKSNKMSKDIPDSVKGIGDYQFTKISDKKFEVSGYGYRHYQCLIMFVCLATAYSMRACIGVALVGMMEDHHELTVNFSVTNAIVNNVNETNIEENSYHNITTMNARTNSSEIELNVTETHGGILDMLLLKPPYPKFRWNKKIQDVIISSFFWGYMTLQIPAGQLVHKFGPRRLLVGALTVNAVVSFGFPWAAYCGGWIFAAICRVLQGLSQACVMPGLYAFLGQWSPLEERSRMVGFATGGQAFGTVLGLPVTGFIAASPLGWPGIFRFYGILSGLVAVLLFYMVYDTPAQHPKISAAEREYIEIDIGSKSGQTKSQMQVPWRHILRSKSLLGIALTHISMTWGQILLFTEIPSFMDKVMHVDIKSNGILTALPFLLMWFSNFFFNWITDWIIIKKYLSVTNARKMANSIGCVSAALGLVILAYAPKTVTVVEIILIFICVFKIAAHVGAMASHVDMAPNFSGTTMSISNFIANLFGSQAPVVTALILRDETSEHEWRYVFFLAAALYFLTNIAYCILGTAEKAPWNDLEDLPEMKPLRDDKENNVIKNEKGDDV